MSKLILDKSDPDIAEAVKDCKVGDTKTFEITVVVTKDDAKRFEGDVSELSYSEPEVVEAEEAPEAEAEEPIAASAPQSTKLKY